MTLAEFILRQGHYARHGSTQRGWKQGWGIGFPATTSDSEKAILDRCPVGDHKDLNVHFVSPTSTSDLPDKCFVGQSPVGDRSEGVGEPSEVGQLAHVECEHPSSR